MGKRGSFLFCVVILMNSFMCTAMHREELRALSDAAFPIAIDDLGINGDEERGSLLESGENEKSCCKRNQSIIRKMIALLLTASAVGASVGGLYAYMNSESTPEITPLMSLVSATPSTPLTPVTPETPLKPIFPVMRAFIGYQAANAKDPKCRVDTVGIVGVNLNARYNPQIDDHFLAKDAAGFGCEILDYAFIDPSYGGMWCKPYDRNAELDDFPQAHCTPARNHISYYEMEMKADYVIMGDDYDSGECQVQCIAGRSNLDALRAVKVCRSMNACSRYKVDPARLSMGCYVIPNAFNNVSCTFTPKTQKKAQWQKQNATRPRREKRPRFRVN